MTKTGRRVRRCFVCQPPEACFPFSNINLTIFDFVNLRSEDFRSARISDFQITTYSTSHVIMGLKHIRPLTFMRIMLIAIYSLPGSALRLHHRLDHALVCSMLINDDVNISARLR